MRLYSLLIFLCFNLSIGAQSDLEVQADSLTVEEEYERANPLYQELATTAFAEKVYNKYLAFKIKQAVNEQSLEHYRAGLDTLQQALNSITEFEVADTTLALLYHKMAVSEYFLGGHYLQKAIEHWQQAVVLRQKYFPEQHPDIVKGYRNIGTAYFYAGQLEESKRFLQQSLDLHLSRSQPDTALLANTYMDLGNLYAQQRDFPNAEANLEYALTLLRHFYVDQPWDLEEIYDRMYQLYYHKQDVAGMLIYAKELIKIFESIEEKIDSDYEVLANAYNNLALTYELTDSLNQALRYYKKSLTINTNQLENRASNRSKNWSNISLVHLKQKDYEKALMAVEQAIQLGRQVHSTSELAAGLNNKASILANMSQYKAALETQQKAIQKLVSDFENDDFYVYPTIGQEVIISDKIRLINYLVEKAAWLQQLAEQENTIKNLQTASDGFIHIAELVGQLRTAYESDASKQFLLKDIKRHFELGISINHRLFEQTQDQQFMERAFDLVEQSKAVILLDAYSESNAQTQAGIPEALIQQEQKLKQAIADLELKLFNQGASNQKLRATWLTKTRTLEALIDQLKTTYPNYYELKYKVATTSLADLQKATEETIIEYFVGNQSVYVFIIQPNDLHWLRIEKDFPLSDWIKSFQEHIRLSSSQSNDGYLGSCDSLTTILHRLYQRLFAPIEAAVELPTTLRIIPDGVLGYLPFELLLPQLAAEPPLFKQHRFLIQNHQISYAYSATLLLEFQQKQTTLADRHLLAVAPEFAKTANSILTLSTRSSSLTPLEHNIPEAEGIANLIGGDMLSGTRATKTNFIDEAPLYRILHLATHGMANDEIGDYSFLVFAAAQDTGSLARRLYNRELYQLRLNAELVVLSACETGLGELQQGEGIISLARGFSYAGAKSIITSLWSVNDVATKNLMLCFYEYLEAGKTKDEALRLAKLDFIQENDHFGAHPFYWASFIGIGDMQPMQNSSFANWKWVLFTLILGGVILFFFFRKGRQSNIG